MKNILHKFTLIIAAPIIWCYIRFIQITSKITISGEDYPNRIEAEGKGHIFVFWHNRQLILPLLRPRDTIHCLISNSRDGDHMASLIKYFNKQSVRGSSSRNGLQAMKAIMRLLKNGEAVGIATDGPRGPAFVVKQGVVQIAQTMQIPIIPVSFDATKKKVLSSWDHTFVAYPFGQIAVTYGEPIWVSPDQSITQACDEVHSGLIGCGELAATILGLKPFELTLSAISNQSFQK